MKKILKIFAFLTAVISSAAIFTGCKSGMIGPCPDPVKIPVTYNGSTKGETFLTGLDGNKIKVSEITAVTDKDHKPTTVLDEKNFGSAECEGFAYAFKPWIYSDALKDPGKFRENEYIGELPESSDEYFRVNAGDKFGSLTVRSAKCDFGAFNWDGEDYLGYQQGSLEFDGEVTLTGLLNIQTRLGANYGDYEREMLFFAEDGMPLSLECLYRPGRGSGVFHSADSRGIVFTDSPQLELGKLSEYPDLDFGGAGYGDVIRAEITVTGLQMTGQCGGSGCFAHAKLVNIKRL